MEDGISPDEPWADSPFPPAHKRTWRHPSELAAASASGPNKSAGPVAAAPASAQRVTPSPNPAPHGRFSAASLVVAAACGALAMAAVLGAFDLIGRPSTDLDQSESAERSDAGSSAALTPADGIVTIRYDDDGERTHHAGLVVDRHGDIVTTAPFTAQTARDASVRTIDGSWAPLEFVAADAQTGLFVVRIVGGSDTHPANAADPDLGQQVALARASSSSNPLIVSGQTSERIVGVNATLANDTRNIAGLATFTVERPNEHIDLVVGSLDGRVVGLVSSLDNHHGDTLAFAIPALTAQRVARQLVLDGVAGHGRLDADLVDTDDGVVIESLDLNSRAAAAGLRAGDTVISLAGLPVESTADISGALLSRGRSTVEAVVIRNGQHISLAVDPVLDTAEPDDSATFASFVAE